MFSEILSPLLRTPGAVAAAFFDPQGQSIAEVGDRSAIEILGAYHSVWLADLVRSSEASGLGELRELAIDFSGLRTASALVSGRYYVVVVFTRDGIPTMGRNALAEACRRLAAEIA
jgi:roadblock/LC7 domain-containing protein